MKLLEPIEGKTTCFHCGKHADVYPLDQNPHPGFGSWTVTMDDKRIPPPDEYRTTLQPFEAMAAMLDKSGDEHDWRLFIHGPLWEGTYQRHAPGQWVLVEQGQGFA